MSDLAGNIVRGAPNANLRYTRREDRIVARRKINRVRDKIVARELGRTPASVNNRWRALQKLLAETHGDIIAKHRAEELALLEQLLAEANMPEMHPEGGRRG